MSIGVISACFIDERISSTVARWSSWHELSYMRLSRERGRSPYLALLVSTIRNILERSTQSALLVPALLQLAAVCGERLDVGEGDGRELRGEELEGKGAVGVESVDVNKAVVDLGHGYVGMDGGSGGGFGSRGTK